MLNYSGTMRARACAAYIRKLSPCTRSAFIVLSDNSARGVSLPSLAGRASCSRPARWRSNGMAFKAGVLCPLFARANPRKPLQSRLPVCRLRAEPNQAVDPSQYVSRLKTASQIGPRHVAFRTKASKSFCPYLSGQCPEEGLGHPFGGRHHRRKASE